MENLRLSFLLVGRSLGQERSLEVALAVLPSFKRLDNLCLGLKDSQQDS